MKDSLLGRREDERLELKSREALGKDLSGVARETVALLNAKGGEVWIGVREKDGVAVELEPLSSAEAAREVRRLRDHLVDTIEPSPGGEEIEVTAEPVQGGEILRVGVIPKPDRKPYAHVRQSARLYVTRVGDRLRPLHREEIAEAFRGSGQKSLEAQGRAASSIEEDLKTALALVAKQRATTYWLRFQPAAELELDFTALRDSGLLTDPERAGVGDLRASFVNAYILGRQMPAPGRSAWSGSGPHLTVGREDLFWLAVRRDGGLVFTVPLQSLGVIPDVHEPEVGLSPFDLLELPISVTRLISAMTREKAIWKQGRPGEADWSASLALFGLRGWILRPGHPLTMEFARAYRPTVYQEDDLIVDPPLAFAAEELRDQPDRCAFRLVARVYEAFGYFEDAIPRQFDRTTGRYLGRQT